MLQRQVAHRRSASLVLRASVSFARHHYSLWAPQVRNIGLTGLLSSRQRWPSQDRRENRSTLSCFLVGTKIGSFYEVQVHLRPLQRRIQIHCESNGGRPRLAAIQVPISTKSLFWSQPNFPMLQPCRRRAAYPRSLQHRFHIISGSLLRHTTSLHVSIRLVLACFLPFTQYLSCPQWCAGDAIPRLVACSVTVMQSSTMLPCFVCRLTSPRLFG